MGLRLAVIQVLAFISASSYFKRLVRLRSVMENLVRIIGIEALLAYVAGHEPERARGSRVTWKFR